MATITEPLGTNKGGCKPMRRVSSKWMSILGAVFALLLAMATIPACDHSPSDEDPPVNVS